jgi:hypothetical protein
MAVTRLSQDEIAAPGGVALVPGRTRRLARIALHTHFAAGPAPAGAPLAMHPRLIL